MNLLSNPATQCRSAPLAHSPVNRGMLSDDSTRFARSTRLSLAHSKGKWLSEGGYGYIAERLFNEVSVDGYFLEYDTTRAGDFAPLSFLPAEKVVVLGLISTKTSQLETVVDLERKVAAASLFVPLERLALSPQCGFASTVGGIL